MDLNAALTVQNLTPPGYFNLSESLETPQATRDFIQWLKSILVQAAREGMDLKKLILTPWLYNHVDPEVGYAPRTPFLQYLLNCYGMGFFEGSNNQAAYLYRLVSSAWSISTIRNILTILQTFSLPPFNWFSEGTGGISTGILVSSLMDTGFVIYSTASSPGTPAPTAYTARDWAVPVDWTNSASEAVKYSKGYISGANIVWCAPRPVSDFGNEYYFSADVPVVVPAEGTVVIVHDDGSGDIGSVYYSDGTAWRKNSYVNADLGEVTPGGARPDPEAISVWSPDPASVDYSIDSQIPPPADGPTEGYGTFATLADNTQYTNKLTIIVNQLAGGNTAISTLIEILKRIKPLEKQFSLMIDEVEYTILDVRQA